MVITELKLWFRKEWKKYIPLIFYFLFISYKVYIFNKEYGGGISIIQCLYIMLEGTLKPDINNTSNTIISIPYLYIIFNFYITYIISYYPFRNKKSIDTQFILKHKNRYKWWLEKCIWNIAAIISFYALGIIEFSVMDFFTSSILNKKTNNSLIYKYSNDISDRRMIYILITAIIISVSIHMFQMLISIIFNKIFSLFITITIYIISIYKCGNLLLGNYLMILRYISLDGTTAVNEYTGMIIGIVLVLLSVIVGFMFVKKVEFI